MFMPFFGQYMFRCVVPIDDVVSSHIAAMILPETSALPLFGNLP